MGIEKSHFCEEKGGCRTSSTSIVSKIQEVGQMVLMEKMISEMIRINREACLDRLDAKKMTR